MDLHHRAQPRAPRVLWLLPWALVLVASTSLAYAMNVAVGSSPSALLPLVDVSLPPTPADLSAAGALFMTKRSKPRATVPRAAESDDGSLRRPVAATPR